jgi:hypothetical protein
VGGIGKIVLKLGVRAKMHIAFWDFNFSHVSLSVWQLPILEGDIPFESSNYPLKSGHFKFSKIRLFKRVYYML